MSLAPHEMGGYTRRIAATPNGVESPLRPCAIFTNGNDPYSTPSKKVLLIKNNLVLFKQRLHLLLPTHPSVMGLLVPDVFNQPSFLPVVMGESSISFLPPCKILEQLFLFDKSMACQFDVFDQ